MKGLVKYPSNFSSPKSSRTNSPVHTSTSAGQISIFSRSPVLREQVSHKNVQKYRSSPNLSSYHQQELNSEESKMLAKIEEQNRLLEADRKSISSEGGGGFLGIPVQNSNRSVSPLSVSTHSSTSNESENADCHNQTWNLWGRIVNDWEDYKKKNAKQLREVIRCGIPCHFRGLVWQLLCNAHNSTHKKAYAGLIRQTSPSEKLIRRDIARTYPEQEFFKEKDGFGQEILFNVIKAYSLVDREVGYCQGSAFIVGLLLMEMPEEEAFAVFVTLMQEYRLRELFKPSMAELGLCMYQLENMLQDHAPELMTHFTAQAIHLSMFASSWFLTLFATFFDLNLASRIMDVFISEGMEIVFRIGLALLLSSQSQLIELDMEGMLKLIQKDLTLYYNKEPNLLFQRAYSLVKYNSKKMKKLEKEYMTMKEREQEEQIEMRRLRTENTLLRQRIESLESENGNLADKLIQDRVNRALEAEEKIIMGKELSIAKRQAMLKSNYGDNTSSMEHSKGFVEHLQQELVQAKTREAEAASFIVELQDKLNDVTERSKDLIDQSEVSCLQEELIAAKLREAECNEALKDLSQRLHMLEENWQVTQLPTISKIGKSRKNVTNQATSPGSHGQTNKNGVANGNLPLQKHVNRTNTTRRASSFHSKSSRSSKAAVQELQEELLSVKFHETKLIAKTADANQKLLELEKINHICTDQLRRSEEGRCRLKEELLISMEKEKAAKQKLTQVETQLADVESKKAGQNRAFETHILLAAPSDDSKDVVDRLQKKVVDQPRLINQLQGQTTRLDVNLSSNNESEIFLNVCDHLEPAFDVSVATDPGLPSKTCESPCSDVVTLETNLRSEISSCAVSTSVLDESQLVVG